MPQGFGRMSKTRTLQVAGVVAAGLLLLTACSGGGGSGAGLSTASILGEAPAGVSGDAPGIKKDDPMARPIQVAWTSARAQRCGFNFDAARLRESFFAAEQRGGADLARIGQMQRVYDETVVKTRQTIEGGDSYCTDKKSAQIKGDLTRHLAGDFAPNFPGQKESGGLLTTANDTTNHGKFDPKTIWQDLQDKKDGVRRN
jgi:hypothetical protein